MIRPVEPTLYPPKTPNPGQDRDRAVIGAEADQPVSRPDSRMLVPTAARTDRNGATSRAALFRPSAAFIAHLFATEAGDPQTRTRRILGADETSQRYAEAIARPALTRDRAENSVIL